MRVVEYDWSVGCEYAIEVIVEPHPADGLARLQLYGSLGATTTVIFFIYLLATLVVTAPILNSSLYEELNRKESEG